MKEGRKPECLEKTPDDELQKVPRTKAWKLKSPPRLEPTLQHCWLAGKADVLTVWPQAALVNCVGVACTSDCQALVDQETVQAACMIMDRHSWNTECSFVSPFFCLDLCIVLGFCLPCCLLVNTFFVILSVSHQVILWWSFVQLFTWSFVLYMFVDLSVCIVCVFVDGKFCLL